MVRCKLRAAGLGPVQRTQRMMICAPGMYEACLLQVSTCAASLWLCTRHSHMWLPRCCGTVFGSAGLPCATGFCLQQSHCDWPSRAGSGSSMLQGHMRGLLSAVSHCNAALTHSAVDNYCAGEHVLLFPYIMHTSAAPGGAMPPGMAPWLCPADEVGCCHYLLQCTCVRFCCGCLGHETAQSKKML